MYVVAPNDIFRELTKDAPVSEGDVIKFSQENEKLRSLVLGELTSRQQYKLGGGMISMLVAAISLAAGFVTTIVTNIITLPTAQALGGFLGLVVIVFCLLYVGIYFLNLQYAGRSLRAAARLAAYENVSIS